MIFSTMSQRHLDSILNRAGVEHPLSYHEILYLLSLKDAEQINKVMLAARKLREKYFGEKVFLYGFIYFSTYCRNLCTFCYYRKENQLSPRYRKSPEEVIEIALRLAESGVHLVDLTMGEDPAIHNTGNYDILVDMIDRVKESTRLPVMVSPGVVPEDVLQRFGEVNANWYALYQETHNPNLYKKLRVGQSFEERSAKRSAARRAGMLVEDGIMLGVGENTSDRADSVLAMKRDNADQVRVMSLVPQPQTPFEGKVTPERISEYLFIAVMRLVMPDRLIPASLDVDGIKGLKMRLAAGANVVTSIIPPDSSLAGVSQSTLDIEQGLRTVPEVKKVLADLGLQVADVGEYMNWMTARKELKAAKEDCHDENRYYRGAAAGFGSSVPGSTGQI
ncbi:MAG: methylornithine synthase PylB [Eubacteriales bacterium]